MVDELLAAERYDLAERLALDRAWTQQRPASSELQTALRTALQGPEPEPLAGWVGATNGALYIPTGELKPHSPDFGLRALAPVPYTPRNGVAHIAAIRARFLGTVFSEDNLDAYLCLLGLTLAGKAPGRQGALVFITGAEGSGKTGAVEAASAAFGDLAMARSANWLAGRKEQAELDNATAEVLLRQPRLVTIEEMGGDATVNTSWLLALTGDGKITARPPHKPQVTKKQPAAIWASSVTPPNLRSTTGLIRRLVVLRTTGELHESQQQELDPASGLSEAIFTRAAQEAKLAYQPGYLTPTGDVEGKELFARETDPAADFVKRLGEESLHALGNDLLDEVRSYTGITKMSKKALSGLINRLTDFTTEQRASGGRDWKLTYKQ